jgi:hypothetical protein
VSQFLRHLEDLPTKCSEGTLFLFLFFSSDSNKMAIIKFNLRQSANLRLAGYQILVSNHHCFRDHNCIAVVPRKSLFVGFKC